MKKLAIFTAFLAGYVVNDLAGEFVPMALADARGIDWEELRYDYDFQQSVEHIVAYRVEDCEVVGSYIDC